MSRPSPVTYSTLKLRKKRFFFCVWVNNYIRATATIRAREKKKLKICEWRKRIGCAFAQSIGTFKMVLNEIFNANLISFSMNHRFSKTVCLPFLRHFDTNFPAFRAYVCVCVSVCVCIWMCMFVSLSNSIVY